MKNPYLNIRDNLFSINIQLALKLKVCHDISTITPKVAILPGHFKSKVFFS